MDLIEARLYPLMVEMSKNELCLSQYTLCGEINLVEHIHFQVLRLENKQMHEGGNNY